MAVTTQNSTQYAAAVADPPTIQEAYELHGVKRVAAFDFTQSGAGDANSIVRLVKLPAGRIRVLGPDSTVKHSAFGAARTLDIGHAAYTNSSGTAVAADEDSIHSAADVSSAGGFRPEDELGTTAGGMIEFDSIDGVVIQAKCEADTLPDAATLNGYFTYIEM